MILLTVPQILYISSSVVAGLLLFILLAFYTYKRVYPKKHYKEATFLKLSRLAKMNDYLLLNNYYLDYDEKHLGCIDHILISKKYIFVINDFPLSGVISGNMKDNHLRLIGFNKEARNISNPLNYNINLIKKLNSMNRLDQTFVKGLVIVNNDASIHIEGKNDQFMMIRRKELKRVIFKADSNKVKPLKEDEVVNFINKLYRKNKKRES